MNRLSVAIPTYGREGVLVETIQNILDNFEGASELLIIDQSPVHDPEVATQLQSWHDAGKLRWVRPERPSLTAARNLAVRLSAEPVVLFLDDDVIISPTLIRQHLARHEPGDHAAVAGRTYQWNHGLDLPSFADPRARDNPHYPPQRYPQDHVGKIDWFVGNHVSVRKADVVEIGGWDESFVGPAFGEDNDVAQRLVRAGKTIFYDAHIELIHRMAPSGGCRIPGNRSWAGWTKSANHFLFMFRHGRTFDDRRRLFIWGLRSGPLLRENIVRPWRWPRTWYDVCLALRYGWAHRGAVQSEFLRPPADRSGHSPLFLPEHEDLRRRPAHEPETREGTRRPDVRSDGALDGTPRPVGTPRPSLITVAIPTYGRDSVLVDTIDSVVGGLDDGTELIVIDQSLSHEPAVARRLEAWHVNGMIRWVRMDRPSLTGARNVALSLASAPVVLFLDDDVVVSPTLIRQHIERHRAGSHAAVAGRVYQWRHGVDLPSFDDPRSRDNPHAPPTQYPLDHVGPIDWFLGGHVSVRKADLIDIGGWDENFIGPAFGEDNDVAQRLLRAGKSIFYDSTIELIHRGAPSGGCRIVGNRSWAGWTKSANHFLYMFRHGRGVSQRWHFFVWGLRSGPLLKENFVRPWRWPRTWFEIGRALRYGWIHHRSVDSEFTRAAISAAQGGTSAGSLR